MQKPGSQHPLSILYSEPEALSFSSGSMWADKSVSGPVILDLELRHEGKEVELEELSIPVIRKGERLKLSFSFDTSEAMLQMWTVLSAENLGKEGSTTLRVKDFSLGFRSGSLPEGFREEDKTVETIGQ